MRDRNLGPIIAASVALILASALVTVWLVLIYLNLGHIESRLDHIDSHYQAPEPTTVGRMG